ncbi:MAG: TIGR02710 family CRISPR-associated protein [Desulfobacterales bacterium]|nr:TIGR02710 family CRISPR-associated protein [Desulfobacterales bacterium]
MKAMIISVGGTIEPIVTSLLQHKPEYVCFFASQQSIDKIGEIKDKLREKGLLIKDYKVICDNVDDLLHCYEKALECAEKIKKEGIDASQVIVDYTGGTKTMTAAIALATVGHGYNFSYVGGKERTKEGLGIVVSGTEVVKTGVSPWHIFAVEEKKRISLFVSSFQYEAAIVTIEKTIENLIPKEKEIWNAILHTLKGYLEWDNFNHRAAIHNIERGLKKLEGFKNFTEGKSLCEYISKVNENLNFLNELKEKTDSFKKIDPMLISDVISNAHRRYLQNKYDDAVARLYRSLEMIGQMAFEKLIGCSTSDVKLEKVPEKFKEEYKNRYKSPESKKIQIGLLATFNILKEMNDPVGHLYFQNEVDLKSILTTRNHSILAHGLQAVQKETYEKLSKIIRDIFVDSDLITFPQLNF